MKKYNHKLINNLQYYCIIWILKHILTANGDVQFITAPHGSILESIPVISPAVPDVTLELDSNVTLECESKVPITWKLLPGYETENAENEVIETAHTPDARRPYGSTLKLQYVTHEVVGRYYCVHNNTDHDNIDLDDLQANYQASSIYVFVNDKENLLVSTGISQIISTVQYADVVVPCKPTSKFVDVVLLKDGNPSNKFDYVYDPAKGFTFKIMHLSDGGLFTCRAENRIDTEIDFSIDVTMDTDYVCKPIIQSETGIYGTKGEKLHLNCTVDIRVGVAFSIEWILPNNNIAKQEGRVEIQDTKKYDHPTTIDLKLGHSSIVVNDLDDEKDQGIYKCVVTDHSKNQNNAQILITILDKDEGSIDISEPNNKYVIETTSKSNEAVWLVNYSGHPEPNLVWYDNRDREIPWLKTNGNFDKYEVVINKSYTTLKIKQLELRDSGDYTLKAYNGIVEREKKFQLIVYDKPSCSVKDVYVQPEERATVVCECAGHPESTITWSFTPCTLTPKWRGCNELSRTNSSLPGEWISTNDITALSQRSEMRFVPEHPGRVRCHAQNSEGRGSANAFVFITDLKEPLSVWGVDDSRLIAVGDRVTITCGALVYDFREDINWYKDGELVLATDQLQLWHGDSIYSYQKSITWINISASDASAYICRANLLNDSSEQFQYKTIEIAVHEPEYPALTLTNMDRSRFRKSLGEPLQFECQFTGIPLPEILWYKDDMALELNPEDNRIVLEENNTTLRIRFVKIEDEGEYTCQGANRMGAKTQSTRLIITNKPTLSVAWIIGISILVLVPMICTIYLCCRVRRSRKLLRELKAAGLANFEEGNPESINPELGLDEQADLLPYDRKYEFPRERLKLGKQLGAGAFGIVVKAMAQDILPYEAETPVAVKMVKHTADNEVMRALVSELKIMVHLGKHLNVVNLLGAVTKNIAKRQVMVIVEYCRFGNIQNFLIKHRKYFIDQIIRETDQIDPNILTKEQQRWSNDSAYEYNSGNRRSTRKSASSTGGNSSGGYLRHSTMAADYFPGGMDSANTEAGLIPRSSTGGEDNLIVSNNSIQPAWRSNYKSDYKGPMRTVTTTDLVCWSFQVARGMEYLSSRKVLHGDLAARNILLCEDNVVKICDFGLAKSMYKSDNYKKKGEAPLPFKWLAIESIGDQIFSTYSDVWSFGIVLWELFSLGKVPYPGMDADQGLYFKLKDGYRMEKPDFATQDIYDIMLQCWGANPESRPLFGELEKKIGKLLENGVAEHYVDLNEPYLQVNMNDYTKGRTDYLSMLSSPDDMAPRPPSYVNCPSTYHTPAMFSSTSIPIPDDQDFIFSENSPTTINNLNLPETNKYSNRKPVKPEEVPMLNVSTNSADCDSESESPSPGEIQSARNNFIKGYIPVKTNGDSVLTTDNKNYVNVPSRINEKQSKLKPDAFTNPGYVPVSLSKETLT